MKKDELKIDDDGEEYIEPGTKYNMVLIVLLLIMLVFVINAFIAGGANFDNFRNPELTNNDIINCNEGRYRISSNEKELKVFNAKPKNLEVYRTGDTCNIIANLKEPVQILGTMLYIIPLRTCDINRCQYIRQKFDDRTTIANCCYAG